MRKKRGYQRDTPADLVRDYKLFAIACEGAEREPMYFKLFGQLSSRIKVDIIEEASGDETSTNKVNRSSPRWVLDRAASYVEKHGLIEEDELWLVIDVDRWGNILQEIASHCDAQTNWHLALSNPCFEVWLYFHLKADIGHHPQVLAVN
jgi:RloB-like protein